MKLYGGCLLNPMYHHLCGKNSVTIIMLLDWYYNYGVKNPVTIYFRDTQNVPLISHVIVFRHTIRPLSRLKSAIITAKYTNILICIKNCSCPSYIHLIHCTFILYSSLHKTNIKACSNLSRDKPEKEYAFFEIMTMYA